MMGLARAYGSDNGSDSDAGPDGNGDDDIPSYGTQFDKRHLQKEPHSDDDDGSVARDSLDGNESENDQDYMEPDEAERERLRQEFLMQARAVRINQRKLARRGIIEDDEGISDCAPHLTTQRRITKDPYRQLDMQAYGGAPRMQLAQRTVPEILTESEDDIDDEICTPSTPRPKIKTAWTEVQTFCKITMEVSQINRAVDEIMEKSLRDAGFRSEHVSHTKATDRVYWKSAHVSDARKSVSFSKIGGITLILFRCLCAVVPQLQGFRETR